MKRKRIAWVTNLLNTGVLIMLVVKGYSPVSGAVACGMAALTILVAVIPEALKEGIVYNDEI